MPVSAKTWIIPNLSPYTAAYGGSLHGRHHELWHFEDLDLARVAESMGVTGIRVDKPGDLESAMQQAVETRGPVLIDAVSDISVLAPKGVATPAER